MQESNLFLLFTEKLHELHIPYIVTGSVATILYGEPRLTHDIDLVIELNTKKAKLLPSAFPIDDFYCPPEEVLVTEAGRLEKGHFNLVHHESGFKADIYLIGNDPLHHWAIKHRKSLPLGDSTIDVAPPEYVILRKLQYYKEGGSDKHIRDIAGMLQLLPEQPDFSFIDQHISEMFLTKEWQEARAAAGLN